MMFQSRPFRMLITNLSHAKDDIGNIEQERARADGIFCHETTNSLHMVDFENRMAVYYNYRSIKEL